MQKLNVTDGQTDRWTGGRCNISRPGPSAPREIKMYMGACIIMYYELELVYLPVGKYCVYPQMVYRQAVA